MRKPLLVVMLSLYQVLIFAVDQATARPALPVIPLPDTFEDLINRNPQFPGGEQALFQFIGEHLKYPIKAREQAVEGTVKVSFIVQPNGEVAVPKITSGLGYGCDKEVLRVIRQMPNWIPGSLNDVKVAKKVTLPISFRLQI